MTEFTVGQARIARVEETYLPVYRPRDIFPEYTERIAAEHARWMAPHHYDPDQDLIKISVHSWLLTIGKMNILIDCCCGNNKRRPARPFWNMLDTLYLERLATAGARPQDIDYEMCTHLHTITLRACSIPVASGIVPRLDRPSGNVTGFALYEATRSANWLSGACSIRLTPTSVRLLHSGLAQRLRE